ncbi:MAG: hypothetical protein H0V89_12590 [Deltaproteobacteria bacterium]|nr:hypothetical protein [Deltaproteobacteria bacterium]
MSPEARGTVATLARLRRELTVDRAAMARRLAEARSVAEMFAHSTPNAPHLAYAALALHAWFTGFESAIERIVRELDGQVPRGDRWHAALLSEALTEIPGIRPAIVPGSVERGLLDLLAFRHFVRHGYAAEIDPVKLRDELDELTTIAPTVDAALASFDVFLVEAIEAARNASS